MSSHQQVVITAAADVVSAGAILATFLGFLPPLAALAAIIWYAVQLWESKTVQKFVRLHKHKRIRHRRHRKAQHDTSSTAARD